MSRENLLVVQWLGLRASTAGSAGSIPGRGAKIPHAVRARPRKQNKPEHLRQEVGGTLDIAPALHVQARAHSPVFPFSTRAGRSSAQGVRISLSLLKVALL